MISTWGARVWQNLLATLRPIGDFANALPNKCYHALAKQRGPSFCDGKKNMLWNAIASLPGCKAVIPQKRYARLFLFKTSVDDTGWLVGPYKDMIRIATDLRNDNTMREFLSVNRVRIGLRDSDTPPADIERKERYGPSIRGESHNQDFTTARLNPIAQSVHEQTSSSVNRKTDRENNVKSFWDSQTPQSHHIVEFNNLETLGFSREVGNEEMDYHQLPAVLLAAEFHQRYISAILKPAQMWEKGEMQSQIIAFYRGLYLERSQLFEPMWQISKLILENADIKGG